MWMCCSDTVVHCGSLGAWGVRKGVTSAGERAKNSRGREGGGRGRDCSAFCLLQSRCCFPINFVPRVRSSRAATFRVYILEKQRRANKQQTSRQNFTIEFKENP